MRGWSVVKGSVPWLGPWVADLRTPCKDPPCPAICSSGSPFVGVVLRSQRHGARYDCCLVFGFLSASIGLWIFQSTLTAGMPCGLATKVRTLIPKTLKPQVCRKKVSPVSRDRWKVIPGPMGNHRNVTRVIAETQTKGTPYQTRRLHKP